MLGRFDREMPTRLRKTRRFRGSRNHGYGIQGQHRKSGSRGGKGKAGLLKHKWSWTVKYDPDHFGHSKLKPPTTKTIKKWLNISRLDVIYYDLNRTGKVKMKDDKPLLNLDELGFEKLLGSGEIKQAYHIVIRSFTKSAKTKVENAGGKITTG
jgi:large subunit ribosomal protein L15